MPRPKNVAVPVPENVEMLTLSQAMTYTGMSKPRLKDAFANPRFAGVFDGAIKITRFHPEIPDLIEVSRASLDAWKVAKDTHAVGTRATRNGRPRRHMIDFTDNRLGEVQAALAPLGLSVRVAYQRKAKAQDASISTPVDSDTPVGSDMFAGDLFTAELVEENELVSA